MSTVPYIPQVKTPANVCGLVSQNLVLIAIGLNLINRMLNFTTNMNDKMRLGMYFVTFGTVISSTNCNLILYFFYILSLCMYLI